MPIYEYKCEDCQNHFEEFMFTTRQSEKNATCPSCGSKNSKKLLSTSSFNGLNSSGNGCAPTSFGGFS